MRTAWAELIDKQAKEIAAYYRSGAKMTLEYSRFLAGSEIEKLK